MTYFNNIHSLEELRKEYKRLVKLNHPDNGGSEDEIKKINAKYEIAFEALKNADDSTNKKEARYNKEMDQAIRDAINRVINLEGVIIEQVGTWLWISGSTYNVREELKQAGFKYSGQRKMWYFNPEPSKKKGCSKNSMEYIKQKYGCEEIKAEQKQKLTA